MKKLNLISVMLLGSLMAFSQSHPPENGYKWTPEWSLTDEFNTYQEAKWYNYHPAWDGRPPSRFKKGNAFITNGELALRSTLHKWPAQVNDKFKDIWVNSAAWVSKKKNAAPGMFFETRMKASNLSMTSSWWFRIGSFSEIDVIEHIGNPSNRSKAWKEYEYHANTHYYGKYNGTPRKPASWIMPQRGRDTYHTLGFYWRKDGKKLMFYHNKKHVMTIWPRKPLTEKLHMIFDTEVFPFATAGVASIGLPRPSHLRDNTKNTAYFKYVRTWKQVPKTGGKDISSVDEAINEENENSLKALQNPITDGFVEIEGISAPDATLYDLQGQLTPCRITTANENSIFVEFENSVSSGIFILRTNDGRSLKLIKK